MKFRAFRHKATGEIRLWSTEQELGTQHLSPDLDSMLEELPGFAYISFRDADGVELPLPSEASS